MANWCENILILRCNNPAQIQRAVKAYNEDRFLSEFFPEPNYETTPVYPACPWVDGIYSAVDPSKAWWHWRVQNWGTKWDVGRDGDPEDSIVLSENGTQVTLNFLSAWTPPVNAMRAFEEAEFSVELYYCEPVSFCGHYTTDGGDKYYNLPDTAAEIREKIPDRINDLFGISEYISQFCEE